MIKESDLKIMSALRNNSRQTLTKISKQTKIPVSTVYDRIKVHEKNAIKKHTSILDFPKIGYNIRLNILLKIKEKEKFNDFVSNNENINSAFRLEGDFEFMIDCIFKEMNEMKRFMEKINEFGIEKRQYHFITDEIIRENFMDGGKNVR